MIRKIIFLLETTWLQNTIKIFKQQIYQRLSYIYLRNMQKINGDLIVKNLIIYSRNKKNKIFQ